MMNFKFQNPVKLLKLQLRDNPQLLRAYVNGGTLVAHMAVKPVHYLLRHLISIQGMNPDTEYPGRRVKEEFQQALSSVFSKIHDHSYDKDFDFSWATKAYNKVRKDLSNLDLGPEDFRKATDLSSPGHNLYATGKALDVAEVKSVSHSSTTLRPDVQPAVPDRTPVDDLADFLGGEYKSGDTQNRTLNDVLLSYRDTDTDINGALKKLVEIADELEQQEVDEPTALMARTEELKKLKTLLKQTAEPTRPLKKNGKIRRTPTGKTNVVEKIARKSSLRKKAEVLADAMVVRGLCDPKDLKSQVDEIMTWPDEIIETYKKIVMDHSNDQARLDYLNFRQDASEQKFKSGRGPFKRSSQRRKKV